MQPEDFIDLTAARKYISQKYRRRLSLSTVWRYAVHGQKGVRLGHVRVGKALRVTRAAVDDFFRQVAAAYSNDLNATPTPVVNPAHEAAERELAAAGL